MINVNVIRIFEGPRHAKLELVWRWYAEQHANDMTLHVFDNTKLRLVHYRAYERMWELESRRLEQLTIFTEFDFLPGPEFLKVRPGRRPLAAQYCTRDPQTMELRRHRLPGAWFVCLDKKHVVRPNFRAGGPFNDPCNELDADLCSVEDCYPRHYGVKVLDIGCLGEHLFWSRHYNDDPDSVVAGFHLRPVLEGVDRAVKEYIAA